MSSMNQKMGISLELENFKTQYLKFSKLILKAIGQRHKENGSREFLVNSFLFGGGNGAVVPQYVVAYEMFIPTSSDDDVFQETDSQNCAKAFFESGLASEIKLSEVKNPSFEQLRPRIIFELIDPIRHLIRGYSRIHFSKRQVLTCLDEYIKIWQGKASTGPTYAPIYNFETEVQTIKLNDYVSIVRFTDEKKTELTDAVGPLHRFFNNHPLTTLYLSEIVSLVISPILRGRVRSRFPKGPASVFLVSNSQPNY